MNKLRIALALLMIAAGSAVLVPLQMLSMKTGLYRETFILRLWHRLILKALGIRVRAVGTLSDKRPLLVAANHVSWTDIMAIGAVADVSFIAKAELAGWPVVGWLSKLQRTVFVARERKRESGQQASEIAERLSGGSAMVLFAEGSTGDGNQLMPFKSTLFGAAKLALDESSVETVYIQPLAIAYTRLHGMAMGRRQRGIASWIGDMDLWPHIKILLAEGAIDVELHFGEPIAFSAESRRKEASQAMESQVREMMQKALRNPLPHL